MVGGELGTVPVEWAAIAIGTLVSLDVLAIGIGVVNARKVGRDSAARAAASSAHRRLDQLLGLDRRASLDELLEDEANFGDERPPEAD